MSRLGHKLLWWAGLSVGIAAIPLAVHADSVNIFNTFGPGHTSACCSGFEESGSNFTYHQIAAMAFTPSVTSTLGAIDVALAGGPDQLLFTLALMTDNGGQPGSTLESWSLTSTFLITACGHCFETVFSTQHPVLQAGTQYWLVPFPSPYVLLNWQQNLIGASGMRAFSLDGGETWSPSLVGGTANGDLGAFDVRSTSTTVPEPSTLILLGSGSLGIAGAARRKLRRPQKSVRSE